MPKAESSKPRLVGRRHARRRYQESTNILVTEESRVGELTDDIRKFFKAARTEVDLQLRVVEFLLSEIEEERAAISLSWAPDAKCSGSYE